MTLNETTQKYLETLLRYYEEEVEGESYFKSLVDHLSEPDQIEKMHLLAKVENFAARSVYPLIKKYDLAPKSSAELRLSGQKQAANEESDWSVLTEKMQRNYPGYVDDFKNLEAMAPPEDLKKLKILTAHEIAALRFLELEAKGDRNSDAPLKYYLETGTS